MIDDKYLELLHGELDGVNSPQESETLTAYLSTHPEARRLLKELRGAANLLREVKPVEPPAPLQYAIMNTISQRRALRAAEPNKLAAIKNWWAEIFEPRFALSFAGGLAMGVLLFALALQLTTKESTDDSFKLYGTIGAPQTEERPAELKSHAINHKMASGEIKWHREGDLLVTEITLAATEVFDLVVLFDSSCMSCKGISLIEGNELSDAVLQAGRLQLSHSGVGSYRIIFQLSEEATVRVQFQRNGELLYDEEIALESQ